MECGVVIPPPPPIPPSIPPLYTPPPLYPPSIPPLYTPPSIPPPSIPHITFKVDVQDLFLITCACLLISHTTQNLEISGGWVVPWGETQIRLQSYISHHNMDWSRIMACNYIGGNGVVCLNISRQGFVPSLGQIALLLLCHLLKVTFPHYLRSYLHVS